MSKWNYLIVVLAAVVAVASGAAIVSMRANQNKRVNEQLAITQGMLAYNHYKDFAALEDFAQKGCIKRLKMEIEYRKNQEKELLVSNFHESRSAILGSYIEQRDAPLFKEIASATPKRSDETATLPPCE